MLLASRMGLYEQAGLNVRFVSPHVDHYQQTPASRVSSGEADVCVTPSETVISYFTAPADQSKPRLRAVATLLQEDVSALVTTKESGIDRPAKLDGKRYASYAARYEGRIVQRMIMNDGGTGDYQELALPMLGLWNTVLSGQADATWVFLGWEGIEAELKQVALNTFKLRDFGIPYGYSPVIVAKEDVLKAGGAPVDRLRRFLRATQEGYRVAVQDPEAAVEAVLEEAGALGFPLDPELVRRSQAFINEEFLCKSTGSWGVMEPARWDSFLDWLSENNLLTTKVSTNARRAPAAVSPKTDAPGRRTPTGPSDPPLPPIAHPSLPSPTRDRSSHRSSPPRASPPPPPPWTASARATWATPSRGTRCPPSRSSPTSSSSTRPGALAERPSRRTRPHARAPFSFVVCTWIHSQPFSYAL